MKCPKNPKILLSRGDALGDVIVTTNLLKPIKKAFPNAEIYYLVNADYIPLLEDHPDVTGCIADPLPYSMGPNDRKSLFKLAKRLKKEKFDVFIGLWENPRYALLSWLARIPIRIGHAHSPTNRLLYSHLVHLNYLDYTRHKVDYNSALLKPLGIQDANTYPVDLHPKSGKNGSVIIHLDAGTLQRVLMPEHVAKIVEYLIKKNVTKIIMSGRKRNEDTVNHVLKHNNHHKTIMNVTKDLPLSQLKDMIANCNLVISPDSGPIHLAAGFGKPVITNYVNRIQNALHWGPWMTPHRIIKSTHNCSDICQPDKCKKPDCREVISIEEYKKAIDEFLDDTPAPHTSQRHYWLLKTLNILVTGPNKQNIAKALSEQGYNAVTHKSDMIKTMNDQNTNLIIVAGKVSLWRHIILEIQRRRIANLIHFFPKKINVNGEFDAIQKIAELV